VKVEKSSGGAGDEEVARNPAEAEALYQLMQMHFPCADALRAIRSTATPLPKPLSASAASSAPSWYNGNGVAMMLGGLGPGEPGRGGAGVDVDAAMLLLVSELERRDEARKEDLARVASEEWEDREKALRRCQERKRLADGDAAILPTGTSTTATHTHIDALQGQQPSTSSTTISTVGSSSSSSSSCATSHSTTAPVAARKHEGSVLLSCKPRPEKDCSTAGGSGGGGAESGGERGGWATFCEFAEFLDNRVGEKATAETRPPSSAPSLSVSSTLPSRPVAVSPCQIVGVVPGASPDALGRGGGGRENEQGGVDAATAAAAAAADEEVEGLYKAARRSCRRLLMLERKALAWYCLPASRYLKLVVKRFAAAANTANKGVQGGADVVAPAAAPSMPTLPPPVAAAAPSKATGKPFFSDGVSSDVWSEPAELMEHKARVAALNATSSSTRPPLLETAATDPEKGLVLTAATMAGDNMVDVIDVSDDSEGEEEGGGIDHAPSGVVDVGGGVGDGGACAHSRVDAAPPLVPVRECPSGGVSSFPSNSLCSSAPLNAAPCLTPSSPHAASLKRVPALQQGKTTRMRMRMAALASFVESEACALESTLFDMPKGGPVATTSRLPDALVPFLSQGDGIDYDDEDRDGVTTGYGGKKIDGDVAMMGVVNALTNNGPQNCASEANVICIDDGE